MNEVNNAVEEYTFDLVSDMFVLSNSYSHPSELHGLLCGQLAAGMRPSRQEWLKLSQEQMNVPEDLGAEACRMLVGFQIWVLNTLQDQNFTFTPLILDAEDPLKERAEALGLWCTGFLAGFGSSGISRKTMAEDTEATLEDLARIAQIQVDDEDVTEEAERDFFEVCEYVRMAALTLFAEQNEGEQAIKPTDDTGHSLH